jgi:hypothetical protein
MHEAAHPDQDREVAPSTASREPLAAATGLGGVQAVLLRLQATVGNRATTAVLARSWKEDKKKFLDALKGKRWAEAAERLNGFDSEAISNFIDDMTYEELVGIDEQGKGTFASWPDTFQKKVAAARKEEERARKVRSDYEEAAGKSDWDRMALLLNAMTIAGIDERLGRLDTGQLGKLDEAVQRLMGTWTPRVHPRIAERQVKLAEGGEVIEDQFAVHGATKGTTTFSEAAEKEKRKKKKWADWLDTRDQTAREFGAADYEDYVRNMLVGGVKAFGVTIADDHPVHPLFAAKLVAASEKASKLLEAHGKPKDAFGVSGMGGQDNRPGNHAWGLAVDIDSAANPYVVNEDLDVGIDELTEPIYERIAQALLGRASVLTRNRAKSVTKLAAASWTELAEESDAMAAYFSILTQEELTDSGKFAAPVKRKRALTARTFSTDQLAKLDHGQVKKDYDMLLGRTAVTGTSGDFPFAGSGAGPHRNPTLGFLSLGEEVVMALRSMKLRWGAVDFGGSCGDVMHFDDNDGKAQYKAWGARHQTAKRKAE